MAVVIGETDYRRGAGERLKESLILLRHEQFAGGIYMAGRAVEGMLRAVIWRTDPEYSSGRKSLDTGHDLRQMLTLVRSLGMLRDHPLRESITVDVQRVARLWGNNMRFWPAAKERAAWFQLREVHGKRSFKVAALEYFDTCSSVMKRCELLWQK
jgi:hypothetical protein